MSGFWFGGIEATEALLRMAEEGEADLKKLEAEEAFSRPELKTPPQAYGN